MNSDNGWLGELDRYLTEEPEDDDYDEDGKAEYEMDQWDDE